MPAAVAASCVTHATGLKLVLLWGPLGSTAPEAEAAALAGLVIATALEAVVWGGRLCSAAALARAAASDGCMEEPLADIEGLLPDPGAWSDA